MEGTYKCTAINKENTASSSATLNVYGKFNKEKIKLLIRMKMNMKIGRMKMRVGIKIKVSVRKGRNRNLGVQQKECLRTTHHLNYARMCAERERW